MTKCNRLPGIFLALLLAAGAASAAPIEGKGSFAVRPDGVVEVDGHTFHSLSEYVNSDYFRATGRRCGTRPPSPEALRRMGVTDCNLSQTVIKEEYYPSYVITIPVAFHVITMADGVTGNVDDARLARQIQALNEDFAAMAGTLGEGGANTHVQFVLHSIDRTANTTWYNDNDEAGFKGALGIDQTRYLNIYTNTASGYLGYSYYPQEMAGQTLDGVVLANDYVGGRGDGIAPYNQGRTATHEVGHYLGLMHTFEGYACQNGYTVGDLIQDTNPENVDHYYCDQTQSCGVDDPIHNYMNYTPDECMNQFTTEQANRMICSILNYRPGMARDAYDLNIDGVVNALDRQALFDYLNGKTLVLDCGATCGDLNGDGKTDAVDAVLMARRLLTL